MVDREGEAFRHHADDRGRRTPELHGLPDRVGASAEPLLPHGRSRARQPAGRPGCSSESSSGRPRRGGTWTTRKRRRRVSATGDRLGLRVTEDQVALDRPVRAELLDRLRGSRRQPRKSCSSRRSSSLAAALRISTSTMRSPSGSGSRGRRKSPREVVPAGPDADRDREREPARQGQAWILHAASASRACSPAR